MHQFKPVIFSSPDFAVWYPGETLEVAALDLAKNTKQILDEDFIHNGYVGN